MRASQSEYCRGNGNRTIHCYFENLDLLVSRNLAEHSAQPAPLSPRVLCSSTYPNFHYWQCHEKKECQQRADGGAKILLDEKIRYKDQSQIFDARCGADCGSSQQRPAIHPAQSAGKAKKHETIRLSEKKGGLNLVGGEETPDRCNSPCKRRIDISVSANPA